MGGEKLTTGERIKKRRKELGYSAEELAKKMGKNRATIYRYEGDEIENMSLTVIDELAEALNVDPAYLMGWTNHAEDLRVASEYNYLPTTISAGIPMIAEPVTNYDAEKISIPDSMMGKWAGSKDIYITRVNGESMNLVIPDQSLIAVKPMDVSELKNGDIVIYNYDNEYAVKRFYKQNDKVVFRPDSSDLSFTDLVIDNNELDLKIKGKVVLYIVELD